MKYSERILWLLVIIVLSLFCDRKMSKIDNLESLLTSYNLNSQIKSDQIIDLMNQMHVSNSNQYNLGYEEGKTYSMIASIKNEDLHDYAEGYHAAIKQIQSKDYASDSDEIYNLFLKTLDMLDDSDHEYNKLLDTLTTELKTESK